MGGAQGETRMIRTTAMAAAFLALAGTLPAPEAKAQARGAIVKAIYDGGFGDRVAILSENRPEWTIGDFGILTNAAVSVPVYPTLLGWQVEYILNDSSSVAVIVSSEEQLQKVLEIKPHCPHIHNIIVCDPPNRTMPPGKGKTTPSTSFIAETASSAARMVVLVVAPMIRRLPPPTAFLVSPVVASHRNSPSMTGMRQKCRSPNFFDTCQPSPK